MRSEKETDFRGLFLIKIRKDRTILLPTELQWNPGDMLELKGYGFPDSIFLSHLKNESYMRKTLSDKSDEKVK